MHNPTLFFLSYFKGGVFAIKKVVLIAVIIKSAGVSIFKWLKSEE